MRSKSGPVERPPQAPTFLQYAWDSFDALFVLKTLRSGATNVFAQNEILFAALGAWVAAPADDELRQAAIIRAVRQKLVRIEATGRAKAASHLVIADICERLTKPGIAAFYEQVYYPIGGLKTLTSKLAHPDFFKFYRERTERVDTALEVAQIYHFHTSHLSDRDEYRPASLDRAAKLVSDLKARSQRKGGDATDNIKKQWRACRASISLAYAASLMHFKAGAKYTDLLHLMQSGGRALKKPPAVLTPLIGRARFFEEHVLSQTYKNEGEGINLREFSDVQATPFNQSHFDKDQQTQIATEFAKRRKGRMTEAT